MTPKKRIHLYVAGIVFALVQAVGGLAGNASFSRHHSGGDDSGHHGSDDGRSGGHGSDD